QTYEQVRRLANKDAVGSWRQLWRDGYGGPEHFLTLEVRIAIRQPGLPTDAHFHLLQSTCEVDFALTICAAAALHRDDLETFTDLVASKSTTANILWPIRDRHYLYPDVVRKRARQVE